MDERQDLIEQLLQLIEKYSLLDAQVMQVARDDAPWNSDDDFDHESLCSELSLMVGRLVEVDEFQGCKLDALLKAAAANMTGNFVEALVAAIYSFGNRNGNLIKQSHEVLEVLAMLVGDESVAGRVVKTGFEKWSTERLPKILRHEDSEYGYKEWLEKQTS